MAKQMMIKSRMLRLQPMVFGLSVLLTLLSFTNVHAQTFSEWFHQDKTQKKYLLAQIAALQTYLYGLEKGYRITRDELTTISRIKDGELGLHTLYFNSLEAVSPAVRHYSKVKGIAQTEDNADIVRKKMMDEVSSVNLLSGSERMAMSGLNESIATDEAKDLKELKLLVSDDSLKMTDDERIKNIDRLYRSVQKKYVGVQWLVGNIHALVIGRKQQQKDAAVLKQLYGDE